MRSEPFSDAELTRDGFLGGRLHILQPLNGYRAAMDPVLLAAATPARPGESVLELGCGTGVASLCLAERVEGLHLSGLELQPAYGQLARHNAGANAISFDLHIGDLSVIPAALKARTFDHVIANPPYFADRDGTAARDPGREIAQREITPLAFWIAAAIKRLKPGGHLTLIQACDRLPDVLAALGPACGGTRILPIASRIGRPAKRIILRTRKGGRGPFSLAAPFILHDGPTHLCDGDDLTPAAREILREGGALHF